MADKNKPLTQEFYTRPIEVGAWQGFKTFLWNSETSQFLGRTGSSWAKILLFYTIFYAALVGFFAAMLAVFWQTLDDKMPKWQLSDGLIGANPGLGFRPMPPDSNVESTLVWYKASDPENTKYWTNELDQFLLPYKETDGPHMENRVNCSNSNPPPLGKVCTVPVESWSPCVSSQRFDYEKGHPCIFLKLNKIFNWEPVLFNETHAKDFPTKMPVSLQEHIKAVGRTPNAMPALTQHVVWVSCEGENPADVENIGTISYYPLQGFPAYYFPFKNIEGYLPPLVAVHFSGPKKNVLINIECKAWAHNIHHDRADRRGSVHFELMIDN